MSRLVGRVGKSKGSPLSPFLYHLYRHEGLLKAVKETAWKIQGALFKYREVGTESELDAHSESDSKLDKEKPVSKN